MTGLYNRLGYEKNRYSHIPRMRDLRRMLMVMFTDINHMKLINDSFGHISGDSCHQRPRQSAIMANIKPDWIAVRFGGDEFLIISGITDETEGSGLPEFNSKLHKPD